MVRVCDTTFGISPEVLAILHWFASRDVVDAFDGLLPMSTWDDRIDAPEIRVTTFYRETQRAGFLVSARPSCYVHAFVHLAVIQHGSTGNPVVIERRASWQRVPPTTEYPEKRVKIVEFESGDVQRVVRHLDERIAAHFREKWSAE